MQEPVAVRGRRLIVQIRIDAGPKTLCVLVDDGEMLHVALNSEFGDFALRHAIAHAQRGIEGVQLCDVACSG